MHRRARRNWGLPKPLPDEDAWLKSINEDLARFIAEWCEIPEECNRGACRRSGRCRGKGVPCFESRAETFYMLLAEMPAGKRLFEIAVAAETGEEDALFE